MPVYGTGNSKGNRGSSRGPSATKPPTAKTPKPPTDKGSGKKDKN